MVSIHTLGDPWWCNIQEFSDPWFLEKDCIETKTKTKTTFTWPYSTCLPCIYVDWWECNFLFFVTWLIFCCWKWMIWEEVPKSRLPCSVLRFAPCTDNLIATRSYLNIWSATSRLNSWQRRIELAWVMGSRKAGISAVRFTQTDQGKQVHYHWKFYIDYNVYQKNL